MKRIYCAVLAALLVLSMSSCSSDTEINSETDNNEELASLREYGAVTLGDAVYSLYTNIFSRVNTRDGSESGLRQSSENGTSVTGDGQFYSEAMNFAFDAGLVGGLPESAIDLDSKITRAQLSVLISRYLEWIGAEPAITGSVDISKCADFSELPSWAADEMAQAISSSCIELVNGLIMPGGFVNTIELSNLINYLTIVSSDAGYIVRPSSADYSGAILVSVETGEETGAWYEQN